MIITKYEKIAVFLLMSILYLIVSLSMIGLASGQEETINSLGDDIILFANVTLIQNCDCSEVIFTSVFNPAGILVLSNVTAQQNGTLFTTVMNGTLNNEFGVYIITGQGTFIVSGLTETFAYTFEISKTSGVLSFSLDRPIDIIAFIVVIIIGLALLFFKQFFFLGIEIFFIGIMFAGNNVNWFISISIIVMGILLAGIGYKTVK